MFSVNFELIFNILGKRKQYVRPTGARSIHQQLGCLPGLANFWPTSQKFFLKTKEASKKSFCILPKNPLCSSDPIWETSGVGILEKVLNTH